MSALACSVVWRLQQVGGDIALSGTAYYSALGFSGVLGGVQATFPNVTSEVLQGALGAAASGDNATAAGLLIGAGVPAAAVTTVLTDAATNLVAAQAGLEATGGYSVELENDWGVGYTIGAAYEIPDIALRAALTYHSEVDHSNATSESLLGVVTGSTVDFASPQSVNLDFQTGIAEDTLLTASVRWANWGDFDVIPTVLGADLANIDDTFTYEVGVARRFSDEFAGSISLSYEATGDDNLVSPLGPTDGLIGLTVGGRYDNGDGMTVTGGINYTKVGDAQAEVGGQSVATFEGNSVVAVGFRVNYEF